MIFLWTRKDEGRNANEVEGRENHTEGEKRRGRKVRDGEEKTNSTYRMKEREVGRKNV